jgi:Na+/proline symporter
MNPQYLNIPQPTLGMIVWSSIGVLILFTIAVFLGTLAKKKWTSFEEFLVGKRDIGPWVTGLALTGSYISGWAFCGSTAIVYKVGFSGMWFAGIWTLVGIIPCVWLAATKTREFSSKLEATTIAQTIGKRFESKGLQILVAGSMLFFLFMYSVGQLKAAGTVWFAVTGLPQGWCLFISIVIAWIFLRLGGYTGTQWFIAVKGAFLGFVGALIGVWAIIWAGGFTSITNSLMAQDPSLMRLINPALPKIGNTQLFSSLVGILATPVIFFTMAVGFPHNISRFLGMKKMTQKEFIMLCFVVWLTAGIPIMLDCSSNGLVARIIFGKNLLANKQWGADLAAPLLSWALGGSGLLAAYLTGLVGAALGTLSAMVFIMSANVTNDIIKCVSPKVSDKSMLYLGYFLIALFLFLPFFWTLNNPPELLAIFMGFAAMGLGAIYFFVTVISYYWKGATKWGAICTVIYGTIGTLFGSWAVMARKPPLLGMGTMEWILIGGCMVLYFGVSFLTKRPSKELIDLLFVSAKS